MLTNMCPDAKDLAGACNSSSSNNYTRTVGVDLVHIGLPPNSECDVIDLWKGSTLERASGKLAMTLPSHATLLVKVSGCSSPPAVTVGAATATATAAPPLPQPAPSRALPKPGPKGLWVWGANSPLTNKTQSALFFDWAAKEKDAGATGPVGTIFLEDEGIAKGSTASLESVLPLADAAGIKVAALYGWNGAEGSFPAASILAFVDGVLALALPVSGGSSALVGISFDIEPRDKPDPTDYQQYATLLAQVRAKLDKANERRAAAALALPKLTLSIAGSWSYEVHNVSCSGMGGSGAAVVSLLDCAVSVVDTYILMNYRNSAWGCSCRPPANSSSLGRNPTWMQCPPNGSPIAGNQTGCKAVYEMQRQQGWQGDGMIAKASAAARAVKASRYKQARLALGVETSCFSPSDIGDFKVIPSCCPLRPHATPFPEEKSILGVIYGVLLRADMNAATRLGAWGCSLTSLGLQVSVQTVLLRHPAQLRSGPDGRHPSGPGGVEAVGWRCR